jgi:TolB-like protein/DNA-binding winged helix-turn-helix (wHTH) protein
VALRVFQFGEFKLDCDRFELHRAGRTLKLEKKPMELLVLLAEKNGILVTRTEIAEHLWEREVFVDTEHGINTAIRKIRDVLDDDPVQSRFVQTVTGKGYRFIAPVAEVRPTPVAEQNEENRKPSTIAEKIDTQTTPAAASNSPIQKSVIGNTEPRGQINTQTNNQTNTPPSHKRHIRWWLVASATLALLIVVGLGVWALRDRSPRNAAAPKISSLAVLPLDNLSGDPDQNYFADGMTDELTTMLAKNSTLRIISRTSAMQYKGVHRPLPEIARELGVDGILEGSIARAGDKVHMTIQLIHAPSDTHVWAESYDRDTNEVVSLPREAAQTIAKQLHSSAPQPPPARYVDP